MSGALRARATTYNGIEMRSRLEAGFAAWLDSKGCDWTYEPRCYASPAGQYLPDFEVSAVWLPGLSAPMRGLIECKPVYPDADRQQIADRMGIIYSTEGARDVVALLATPRVVSVLQSRTEASGGTIWYFVPVVWLNRTTFKGDELSGGLCIGRQAGRNAVPWQDGYWEGPSGQPARLGGDVAAHDRPEHITIPAHGR